MSVPPSSSSSSLNRKVVTAIVATFACTLVIAAILFFLYDKFAKRRWRNKIDTSLEWEAVITREEFRKFGGKLKGLIIEENGRNVIYVKDLEDKNLKTKFSNVVLNPSYEAEEMKEDTIKRIRTCKSQEVKAEVTGSAQPNVQSMGVTPSVQNPAATLPTFSLPAAPPTPPSPPPPPPPPPPPTIRAKRHSVPPPPPPKAGRLVSSLKPPSAPRWNTNNKSGAFCSVERSLKGTDAGNMKLKPLHWDKVMANADHSVVWNEIIDGSLRFDDNQMETLFGYTSASYKTWPGNGVSSGRSSPNPVSSAQTFILESRKSQNSAIVLRSLGVSRSEILDSLLEGHGLATDVLEKLTRIAPTQEETAEILQFKGNPSELAAAESFLYHILKAVPSAFIRINAMLFRSNYDAEILHHKESLQTLELGCNELRTRGIFLKLLEAILKAGNRMNAGTSWGNAQGFNLTTLRKISDVKSNDGKTTLLHFVVEQVARSEGRRRVLNENRIVQRTEAEGEEEYLLLQLGLQSVKGSSIEFSNVKKAATMDYDNLLNTISCLTAQISKIRMLITRCGNGDGFVREIKGFLEETEEEIKVVAEEQTRILELVKKTTDYYQAGGPKQGKANLLELFVIVKDFLDMVNQVCVDISQKMQTKNLAASIGSTSPPLPPPLRSPVKFHNFYSHWASESSTESDDDF